MFVIVLGLNVDYLEENVEKIRELSKTAHTLENQFSSLVFNVQQSLIDHNVNLSRIKSTIRLYKIRCVSPLQDQLKNLKTIEDVFNDFLIRYRFIGYLNYVLLKRLAYLVHDENIKGQFEEYETMYVQLLKNNSFRDLIVLFKEHPELSPTAKIGLPSVVLRLDRRWWYERVYSWIEFIGGYSWSDDILLEELKENCILIKYAILPTGTVDTVIQDLTDVETVKKLKTNGVEIVKLPTEGTWYSYHNTKSI